MSNAGTGTTGDKTVVAKATATLSSGISGATGSVGTVSILHDQSFT
ncbi:MAG: hypothetical protein CM15mV96_430 [uncultured marine virus]|nr:MAG: hypothetical protein CM15mV96_430 [uncultured marine virus]